MDKTCVGILLAAYNGEKYIAKQIDSILKQTYTNWQLWVRIDSSTDNTEQIVLDYSRRDERINILPNNGLKLGASLNFGALMVKAEQEEYQYIMFSDQDDFWMPDKIKHSLNAIVGLERQLSSSYPILIHTDFQYTDQYLTPIETSDNVAIKLSKRKNKILLIANDNYIFGCTMMLNQALLKLANPVRPGAENHDFWVALHAASFGYIEYINEKTMYYRQHDNNVSGGLRYSSILNRLRRLLNFDTYIKDKRNRIIQFDGFFEKEKERFTPEDRLLFQKYLANSKTGGPKAVAFMFMNGFKMRGIMQTIVYYISLLLD